MRLNERMGADTTETVNHDRRLESLSNRQLLMVVFLS